MTSEANLPYLLNLRDSVRRLEDVEFFGSNLPRGAGGLQVALPVSYHGRKKRAYPVVLVMDSAAMFGSAVEMSRLMAQTSEIAETIVVGIECQPRLHHGSAELAATIAETLQWCRARYRVGGGSLLFGAGAAAGGVLYALLSGLAGVDHAVVSQPAVGTSSALRGLGKGAGKRLLLLDAAGGELEPFLRASFCAGGLQLETGPSHAQPGWAVADLVSGLRILLATGKRYGDNVVALRKPVMRKLMYLMSPLMKRKGEASPVIAEPNPQLLRSAILRRDFELFVSLPPSWSASSRRTYPALLVLDANIEYSTVAEAAAAMARAGLVREMIVVGIGTPRAEGAGNFGYRRFEEFAPEPDGYAFDDALGNIFRALFAARGQDARLRVGQAGGLYRFIREEALPRLLARFPIDADQLGLLGHSAGGTFTCYALLQQDSPFEGYAAISPGIGINGSWLLRQLDGGRRAAARARGLVLSVGAEEMHNAFNRIAGIPDTSTFGEKLRGLSHGRPAIEYHNYEAETHSTTYPRAVAQALLSLHGRAATDTPAAAPAGALS